MVLYTAVLYGAVLRGAGLGGATSGHVSVFLPRSIATHVPPLGPQPTLSPPLRGRILSQTSAFMKHKKLRSVSNGFSKLATLRHVPVHSGEGMGGALERKVLPNRGSGVDKN